MEQPPQFGVIKYIFSLKRETLTLQIYFLRDHIDDYDDDNDGILDVHDEDDDGDGIEDREVCIY